MARDISKTMQSVKSLFFIGIGGINMSALALACRRRGIAVAGSDRAQSAITERLQSDGVPVISEHRAENITGYDAVVYNGAIGDDNPELSAAREKGLPLIYRADLLGWIMRGYERRIGASAATSSSEPPFFASPTAISPRSSPFI